MLQLRTKEQKLYIKFLAKIQGFELLFQILLEENKLLGTIMNLKKME